MDKLLINGQRKLRGHVRISGAKNAALPIFMASLLSSDKLELINAPELQDIKTTIKLLKVLGVVVSKKETSINFNASKVNNFDAPYELVKTMRASILVLGPLLARFGKARVSMPGGCAIGSRPVDIHIKGLEAMGAKIAINHGYIEASSSHLPNGRLQGAKIFMDQVTVTGTENLLMAAVLADGVTTLDNAAREPEVVDLANCLRKMGAIISGEGTDIISIEGVKSLSGCEFSVMPDRVEVATYLTAVAMTGGKVKIKSSDARSFSSVIDKLEKTGAVFLTGEDWVSIEMNQDRPLSVSLTTGPYPSFPTDMQAQFVALNSIADGNATVTETIFENRFMHVQEIARMGGQISLKGNTAFIEGADFLVGAPVMATDLRASASLVLAGLVASGETTIDRIYHIDRGYERIEEKLKLLGADIERIS